MGVAASCDVEMAPEEGLRAVQESIGFHFDGGGAGLTILVNSDYTATINCNWCTLTYPKKKYSDGRACLHLMCEPNETTERREAIVTITTGFETIQVPVFQNRQNTIEITQTEFEVAADSTTVSFTFQTAFPAYFSTHFTDDSTYLPDTFPRQMNPNRRAQWILVHSWVFDNWETTPGTKQTVTLTILSNGEQKERVGYLSIGDSEGTTRPINIIVKQSSRN